MKNYIEQKDNKIKELKNQYLEQFVTVLNEEIDKDKQDIEDKVQHVLRLMAEIKKLKGELKVKESENSDFRGYA